MAQGLDLNIDPADLLIPRGPFDGLAVKTGFLGGWFLGNTLEGTLENRQDGGTAGVSVGTDVPGIQSFYAEIGRPTRAIQLPVTDRGALTIFTIARNDDVRDAAATSGTIVGNTVSGGINAGGATLYFGTTTINFLAYCQNISAGTRSTQTATLNLATADKSWRLLMARYEGYRANLRDLTAGTAKTDDVSGGSNATHQHAMSVTPYSIGGSPSTSYTGKTNNFLTFLWEGWMADADATIQAAQFRAMAVRRGITV